MAHGNQHLVVRGGRHPTGLSVRTLSFAFAVVALTVLAPRAEGEGRDRFSLTSSGDTDLPSWWSRIGRPGGSLESAWGGGGPWTLAGHALGGWILEEPARAPRSLPLPGQMTVHTSLSGYDSVRVDLARGSAWRGFDAALARISGERRRDREPRASGVIDLRGGDFEFDEDALLIERADSRGWTRLEVMNGSRGEVGGFESSGRHLWAVAGGMIFRRTQFEGSFSQRGAATRLIGTEEQASGGESGHLLVRRSIGTFDVEGTLARGRYGHESFGEFFIVPRPGFGTALDYSRRDAQENLAALEIGGPWQASRLGARVEWRHSLVARSGAEAFVNEVSWVWGAGRFERRVGEGRFRVEIGAGKHTAGDPIEVAPAISYEVEGPVFRGRVGIERLILPVWTDLAPGQTPFRQRTWLGVLEAKADISNSLSGWSAFLVGRTRNRALLSRMPIEELWLREGVRADPERYDFGLLSLGGEWRPGPWSWGGDAFFLVREQGAAQAAVDPNKGLRAHASRRFMFFEGDLGIILRAGMEGVGARESEAIPSQTLPGYVTGTAGLIVTLADAVVTIQMRNLEDRRRRQVWIDSDTGEEALGPGRELRFSLTVRLRD